MEARSFLGERDAGYRAIQFFGFFTILFEKVQPEDHTYSEMSGFGDPSYRKTK